MADAGGAVQGEAAQGGEPGLNAVPADVVFEGEYLGRWVQAQRACWPVLKG
ncbi:helicase associated domain-containing protein [Streptomyces sp. NPDC039016]|uniref:helicase associated domain-containing protein n=1 Tax=Streptomyces sp. NPDC039016 TaxID=3154330 RepID=UPI0033FA8060